MGSLSHNDHLDRPGSGPGLVEVHEIDKSKFSQIHLAISHHQGLAPAQDGGNQMGIGVVAATGILTVLGSSIRYGSLI